MAKKQVIISFDYEHDRHYYRLLKAWDANKYFDFFFSDLTPQEIKTKNVSVVKQVLSSKIHDANYMIAIIGAHSNELHPDYLKIGHRNWQAYEISKNFDHRNGLVAVKLNREYEAPVEAYNIGTKWVYSFNEYSIIKALNELG